MLYTVLFQVFWSQCRVLLFRNQKSYIHNNIIWVNPLKYCVSLTLTVLFPHKHMTSAHITLCDSGLQQQFMSQTTVRLIVGEARDVWSSSGSDEWTTAAWQMLWHTSSSGNNSSDVGLWYRSVMTGSRHMKTRDELRSVMKRIDECEWQVRSALIQEQNSWESVNITSTWAVFTTWQGKHYTHTNITRIYVCVCTWHFLYADNILLYIC